MSIERMSQATLGVDPLTGRPVKVTNMSDVVRDSELPESVAFVDCPSPCQTHGAPPTENPYNPTEETPRE
jgi:hypothetical protein